MQTEDNQSQTNPQGVNPAGQGDSSQNPAAEEKAPPANYELGGHLPKVINYALPEHSLEFDEQLFLQLLAGSISLSKEEKKKILNSMPNLKQGQVDELIKIFQEEKRRFAELSDKHVPQLEKLEKKHASDWSALMAGQEQDVKSQEDDAKADDIRKQLGL